MKLKKETPSNPHVGVHQPEILESYHFYLETKTVVGVMVQGALSTALIRQYLCPLAFCYAPIALISLTPYDHATRSYLIAQCGDRFDVDWAIAALCRFEPRWEMADGLLISPSPSTLKDKVILEVLAEAANRPS